MSAQPRHGIGTRTLRGVFWAYGSFVGGRLTTLVATAILARLLVPRDFGLVALALIFMTLLESVSDLGVSQALVVADKEQELERAETVFVWNTLLGAVLSGVTAACGPLAAAFFNQPRLGWMVPVLGLRFFLRSLGATHYALAQKWIDFRPRTIAELADAVVRGLTGVGLAVAGLGAWSLVLGYVVGTIALSAVVWMLVPWRPHLTPKREHLSQLLRFGGTLTGIDVLSAIQSQTDYVFIGRVLGAADLGLYTLGFNLPSLLIGNLTVVAGRVLFPAFAAVDRRRLPEAFQLSVRYMLMFALPISAGLAVLAHPLIVGIFGEKWRASVEPMQILTIYGVVYAIGIPAGTVLKSVGRAGVLLVLAVPRTLILIAAIAILVHQGINAVAAAVAAVTAIFAVIGFALTMNLLRLGPRELWTAGWPALLATGGMVAVLIPIEQAISAPVPAILVGVPSGAAVYLGLLAAFARDALFELRDIAFPPVAPAESQGAREPDLVA